MPMCKADTAQEFTSDLSNPVWDVLRATDLTLASENRSTQWSFFSSFFFFTYIVVSLLIDYHRCQKALTAKGVDTTPCEWYGRVFKSLCPIAWVNKQFIFYEISCFPKRQLSWLLTAAYMWYSPQCGQFVKQQSNNFITPHIPGSLLSPESQNSTKTFSPKLDISDSLKIIPSSIKHVGSLIWVILSQVLWRNNVSGNFPSNWHAFLDLNTLYETESSVMSFSVLYLVLN